MKLACACHRARRRQRGWALLAVMSLSAAGLMVLAGVMNWADETAEMTARNNEYFTTAYAAESATEKALTVMAQQFQVYGLPVVNNNMTNYATSIPTAAVDGPYWQNYQFYAGSVPNQMIVTNMATVNNIMGAPYAGLTLVATTYEIISTAVNTNSHYQIPATVGQQVYFGYIPLFQFAIFYQDYMELEPNAPMTVTGAVHGNADIYAAPLNGLTFSNAVSASGQISVGGYSTVNFDGGEEHVDPLNLPVGANNNGTSTNVSQNVYGILQLPQAGQTPTSASGQNLLYNQADLIIVISNNGAITVTSGAAVNGQATAITNYQSFLNTNGSFYDQRDDLTVNPVVIDVSNLVNWSATNTTLRPVLASARGVENADVQSIYVADLRGTTNQVVTTSYTYTTNYVKGSSPVTTATLPANYPGGVLAYVSPPIGVTLSGTHITSYTYYPINQSITTTTTYVTNMVQTTQPGIVLSNGAVLPPEGLAVATPDPAYIVGNWNIKNSTNAGAPSDAGLNDTTYTLPSAVYADAITVLSSAWNPANSTLNLTNRDAVSDTVNSAFLTGNVPTSGNDYSGGVENLARLLENWTGQTLTYNGSMVCMFNSQIANQPYQQPGSVFNPPTRNWAFDNNFTNPAKDPPLTPKVSSLLRNKWVLLPPYATSF